MSKEFLSHIFEPFAQEKNDASIYQGTGLGMAIVKELINQMKRQLKFQVKWGSAQPLLLQFHLR